MFDNVNKSFLSLEKRRGKNLILYDVCLRKGKKWRIVFYRNNIIINYTGIIDIGNGCIKKRKINIIINCC